MLDKIKSLGADTAIYGVSTIVGRFLNFLLVPFYTNVLSAFAVRNCCYRLFLHRIHEYHLHLWDGIGIFQVRIDERNRKRQTNFLDSVFLNPYYFTNFL